MTRKELLELLSTILFILALLQTLIQIIMNALEPVAIAAFISGATTKVWAHRMKQVTR